MYPNFINMLLIGTSTLLFIKLMRWFINIIFFWNHFSESSLISCSNFVLLLSKFCISNLLFFLVLIVKNLHAMWETQVWSLGWEDTLEKGMATHSSILAWRIPWTEAPRGIYCPLGHKELDMTDRLTLSLSIFFIFYKICLINLNLKKRKHFSVK